MSKKSSTWYSVHEHNRVASGADEGFLQRGIAIDMAPGANEGFLQRSPATAEPGCYAAMLRGALEKVLLTSRVASSGNKEP